MGSIEDDFGDLVTGLDPAYKALGVSSLDTERFQFHPRKMDFRPALEEIIRNSGQKHFLEEHVPPLVCYMINHPEIEPLLRKSRMIAIERYEECFRYDEKGKRLGEITDKLKELLTAKYPRCLVIIRRPLDQRAYFGTSVSPKDHPGKTPSELYQLRKQKSVAAFLGLLAEECKELLLKLFDKLDDVADASLLAVYLHLEEERVKREYEFGMEQKMKRMRLPPSCITSLDGAPYDPVEFLEWKSLPPPESKKKKPPPKKKLEPLRKSKYFTTQEEEDIIVID